MAAQEEEKRGPVEKGPKGWPINPFGVVALIIFGIVLVLFVVRPLLNRQSADSQLPANAAGGRITTPNAGEIVRSQNITIELSVDEPEKVQKVQFWAKTYADGKWEMIGETTSVPYKLAWQIPGNFQNKAVALTTHIYQKDGKVVKDPGGWREGIILLRD